MNIPEMQKVSSSNVDELGYNSLTKTAFVKFKNGSLYAYEGVSQSEFDNLLHSSSIGSYLHSNFKGVYPYKKIG